MEVPFEIPCFSPEFTAPSKKQRGQYNHMRSCLPEEFHHLNCFLHPFWGIIRLALQNGEVWLGVNQFLSTGVELGPGLGAVIACLLEGCDSAVPLQRRPGFSGGKLRSGPCATICACSLHGSLKLILWVPKWRLQVADSRVQSPLIPSEIGEWSFPSSLFFGYCTWRIQVAADSCLVLGHLPSTFPSF